MNYPKSNRTIPPNVEAAIKFAGKTGVMSRRLWNNYFNAGSKTWRQRQINKLFQKDIFKAYLKIGLNEYFRLSTAGLLLSNKLGVRPVLAPLSNQIVHDEYLSEVVLALGKKSLISDWLSESEIRAGVQFQGEQLPMPPKLPDALLKLNVKGETRKVAFEYERTLKAHIRIRDTLRAYARMPEVALVLILCEEECIKDSYLKTLVSLQDTVLKNRVGLSLANGWIESPELQRIQMLERSFCLKDILLKIS